MKNAALALKMRKYKKSEIIEAFSQLFEADEVFEKALFYLDDKKRNEVFERERMSIEKCSEKVDTYIAWQKEIVAKYGTFSINYMTQEELKRGNMLGRQMEQAIKERDAAMNAVEKMFLKG